MSAQSVGLDLELAAQPSRRANGAERQNIEGARKKRRAVFHRWRCWWIGCGPKRVCRQRAGEAGKGGSLDKATAGDAA